MTTEEILERLKEGILRSELPISHRFTTVSSGREGEPWILRPGDRP